MLEVLYYCNGDFTDLWEPKYFGEYPTLISPSPEISCNLSMTQVSRSALVTLMKLVFIRLNLKILAWFIIGFCVTDELWFFFYIEAEHSLPYLLDDLCHCISESKACSVFWYAVLLYWHVDCSLESQSVGHNAEDDAKLVDSLRFPLFGYICPFIISPWLDNIHSLQITFRVSQSWWSK